MDTHAEITGVGAGTLKPPPDSLQLPMSSRIEHYVTQSYVKIVSTINMAASSALVPFKPKACCVSFWRKYTKMHFASSHKTSNPVVWQPKNNQVFVL